MSKWRDTLDSLFSKPALPEPPELIPEPEPPTIHYLDDDDIENLVDSLDYERIHRAMLLFDIRWESAGDFIVPDEGQIHEYASHMMRQTIERGRRFGLATTNERHFEFSHALTQVGREFASLQYTLTSARNPQ